MKLNPKMGFWRAKHGLSKHVILKTKIGLICGEKKRGEEGEKRKKKRRRGRRRIQAKIKLRYGTNLGYEIYYGSYGFCMEF